jgi:SMI1 / KNR4 family (SUKH-1)
VVFGGEGVRSQESGVRKHKNRQHQMNESQIGNQSKKVSSHILTPDFRLLTPSPPNTAHCARDESVNEVSNSMDLHAVDYYSAYSEQGSRGHFHHVIALHHDPFLDWGEASKVAPVLCRGWYELSQLPIQDRIEFTRDFWLAKLPYHPDLNAFLVKFFASLDDIGVFLTQRRFEEPYEAHLVYSLADNSGFFHGESPAEEVAIIRLQKDFANYTLPADYLAFLQIHNGFAKLTDTGVTPSAKMKETYDVFQKVLEEGIEPISTIDGTSVNPASLIPFYESFGMPFFQCFWGDWYPDQEMGNVYYSPLTRTISTCKKKDESAEMMAFESFMDWLMFYLEKID